MSGDTTPLPFYVPDDDELTIEASVGFRERLLLALAGLFLLVTHSGLIAARGSSVGNYWHLAVWAGCAAIGHLILRRRLPRRDPFMFPIVMLLAGWGLTVIDRLAPLFATRQTLWLVIGLGAMLAIVVAPGHLRWLSRYRYLWLVGGLILLVLTIVVGRNPSGGGPRLWLGIFDAYFQPSELLKVLLVVFFASYLADHRPLLDVHTRLVGPLRLPSMRFLAPLLLMWGITVVVLMWQQDLGTATLFFVVFLAMLYIATGEALYVIEGAVLLIVAGAVAYVAFDVVRLRMDVWWNPWPEFDNRAFQIVQSLMAFSAGGVFGQGVGQGSPTYIPVVHSDFAFAAIGEEWGLIGTLTVMTCVALFVLRGLRVAARSEARPFRSFLAAGISVMFGMQSLLIMGGVLKLVPLTGVTLPFLSYGGSSLLASSIMAGLLIVLSGEQT
jgi:cell division protein FtsW (lipid II flippase)